MKTFFSERFKNPINQFKVFWVLLVAAWFLGILKLKPLNIVCVILPLTIGFIFIIVGLIKVMRTNKQR